MSKGLTDFVVEDNSGMLIYDIKKITSAGLSLHDFRRKYIEEMQGFFDNHNNLVSCSRCFAEIATPENLIRYFGNNLHFSCFTTIYGREREGLEEKARAFFDIVRDSI